MIFFKRFLFRMLPGFVILLSVTGCSTHNHRIEYIRINQVGYFPDDLKKAVWISSSGHHVPVFTVVDAETGSLEDTLVSNVLTQHQWGYDGVAVIDFSGFRKKGVWKIRTRHIESVPFRIGEDIYDGSADFLLQYIRQQQCGYNPFFGDSCHTRDGFVVFSPDPRHDSVYVDVTGGWHDASDYLRYVTTSATTVLQLLMAWERFPEVFGDAFDASGDERADGVPDVINSARWGMDWLVKMNPYPERMYHQIADDRDHIGFKVPAEDNADYGKGRERPVYVATGKPQGSARYKNHSTGIASIAGKFASSFAAGARLLKEWYPEYARTLEGKAMAAYTYGMAHPGVCQTAPHLAPYYYTEQNWTDDMETAASQLWLLTGDSAYLTDAIRYGMQEPVSPWMGKDTATHYQWYPFVNAGHLVLASAGGGGSGPFRDLLREGLTRLQHKASGRPFENGVPFIWCSNNLTASALVQAIEYRRITHDSSFLSMETSMRDWLLGTNPWGTSMIIGYPAEGDFPEDVHSVVTVQLHKQPFGGLVDGPVYTTIFSNLKGIYLAQPDEYADIQPSFIVYHDDFADYSTNEPTLDGTASLVFCFAALESRRK